MSEITHRKADEIRRDAYEHWVFISTPMSGKTDKEIQKRLLDISRKAIQLACKKFGWLEEETWWYSNYGSIRYSGLTETEKRLDYLGDAIKKIGYASAVYFDEGWIDSKGCITENCVCKLYEIPYVDWSENLGGDENAEESS